MIGIFLKIRQVIISKLGINLFGMIAVGALIWLALFRFFNFSLHTSCYFILLYAVIVLLVVVVRYLWIKKRGDLLADSIAVAQNELREKLNTAINCLKCSEVGVRYRGCAALYALPWFLIIGASGTGKSTLIRKSGLKFPLASEEDLRVMGFGGTRNCDCWFTDQAIILDTAGRYTTESEDHREWLGLLQLLRRYRPKLPLNGVLLTFSVSDLFFADEQQLIGQAKIIRERIYELYQHLGYVFPITLVLTKADLIYGFDEFFNNIKTVQRSMPWGVFVEEQGGDFTKVVDKMNKLTECLRSASIVKVDCGDSLLSKLATLNFPAEFKFLQSKILRLLELLLHTNPYQETPRILGVYFTSSAREGALLSHHQSDFIKRTPNSSGASVKSYFVAKTFESIIFDNCKFIARTNRSLRWQLFLKTMLMLTSVVCVGGWLLVCSISYSSNKFLLHSGEGLALQIAERPEGRNFMKLYDLQQSLQKYRDNVPWYLRLGFYRAEMLIDSLREVMFQSLRRVFVLPLTGHLERKLRIYTVNWSKNPERYRNKVRGEYYTALKAYLMLFFPEYSALVVDGDILSCFWHAKGFGGANLSFDDYSKLAAFYLNFAKNNHYSVLPELNWGLLKKTRNDLLLSDNAVNVYAEISFLASQHSPAITVDALLHNATNNVFISREKLPGIFTAKAYSQSILPNLTNLHDESWVFNAGYSSTSYYPMNKNISLLRNRLLKKYYNNYINAWSVFIGNLQIPKFTSFNLAYQQLQELSLANNQIRRLLKTFSQNFDIEALRSYQLQVDKLLGDKDHSILTAYENSLHKLSYELQGLGSKDIMAVEGYAADILSGKGSRTNLYQALLVAEQASGAVDDLDLKDALYKLLLQPIKASWQLMLIKTELVLQQRWLDQVYSFYLRNLHNKFPFVHNANLDARLIDVDGFFHPDNGILWSFANSYLLPFTREVNGRWVVQTWQGEGVDFSQGFLEQLQQMNEISKLLFANNTGQIGFDYHVRAEPAVGVSKVVLAQNDQIYTYHNEPQEWRQLLWPGQSTTNGSYLAIIAASNENPGALRYHGEWGLLHLLQRGHLDKEQNGVYRATWSLSNAKRSYNINLLFDLSDRGDAFFGLLSRNFYLSREIFK